MEKQQNHHEIIFCFQVLRIKFPRLLHFNNILFLI